MRNRQGLAAVEDLTVLLVAVVSFSLFFASLAASFAIRESRERGESLQGEADDLLEAVLSDPRWTSGQGLLVAAELSHTSTDDLRGLAMGRPFLVVVWDLRSHERWTFGGEETGGDRRTAATSANVVGEGVDPARVVATVWRP